MSKHTPTPWNVAPRVSPPKRETEKYITGPNEMIIAKLMYAYQDGNAAFIVRACNAHDALVEALAATLKRYVELASSGDCGFWNPEEEKHVEQSRAALKLAKES